MINFQANCGYVVTADCRQLPMISFGKNFFDISDIKFDKADIETQWVYHDKNIFLRVFWPEHECGFTIPFSVEKNEQFIKDIVSIKSLAISNTDNMKKSLLLEVVKNDPLEWIEKYKSGELDERAK